jgi:hypothetical protein
MEFTDEMIEDLQQMYASRLWFERGRIVNGDRLRILGDWFDARRVVGFRIMAEIIKACKDNKCESLHRRYYLPLSSLSLEEFKKICAYIIWEERYNNEVPLSEREQTNIYFEACREIETFKNNCLNKEETDIPGDMKEFMKVSYEKCYDNIVMRKVHWKSISEGHWQNFESNLEKSRKFVDSLYGRFAESDRILSCDEVEELINLIDDNYEWINMFEYCLRCNLMRVKKAILYAMDIDDTDSGEVVGSLNRQEYPMYSKSLGDAGPLRTPDLEIRDMREAEAIKNSAPVIMPLPERFLKESPKVGSIGGGARPEEAKTRKRPVQEVTRRKIAEHRISFPLAGITETYVAVGISPETGRKHVKEMKEIGWLEGPESMPFPGESSKTKKCYAVTEKGCEALGLEWNKARLPGKGSLKSRLAARMIGEQLESQGKAVRYEYSLSSDEVIKAADVAVLETDGSVVAYEYKEGLDHAVEDIERNRVAGFIKTVVVCRNDTVRNKVIKKAEKENCHLFVGETARSLKEFA